MVIIPRRKKLRKRREDDEDLLDKRLEHAEENCDIDKNFVYGICDWCDIEHYLAELNEPYNAEICRFCMQKQVRYLEGYIKKIKIMSSSSP